MTEDSDSSAAFEPQSSFDGALDHCECSELIRDNVYAKKPGGNTRLLFSVDGFWRSRKRFFLHELEMY